ncbi:MAG: tetratricopeptide repeat protein [Candidatus Dadabacteria bacterium]|nr:MAG: tetratricopeptide repeat protein [Candidatus Dadabacteria bacterium]
MFSPYFVVNYLNLIREIKKNKKVWSPYFRDLSFFDSILINNASNFLRKMGHYYEAVALLTKYCKALKPRKECSRVSKNNLALALAGIGKIKEAKKIVKEALEASKIKDSVYFNLKKVYEFLEKKS